MRVERRSVKIYRITREGMESLRLFPEEELVEILLSRGGSCGLDEIRALMGEERAEKAIAWARRRGWVKIEKRALSLVSRGSLEDHKRLLKLAEKGFGEEEIGGGGDIVAELLRRRMLLAEERREISFEVLEKGYEALQRADVAVVSKLTPEIIAGRLRGYVLKPYNVDAEPREIYPGYKHFYADFLEMVRDVMASLGFEEIDDELVVPELWNFDALFQAQDHPAREIHDTLAVDGEPADLSAWGDLVERVARVHETGWGYSYDRSAAARLVMRSQTTAATIRYLHSHREPPVRAFIVGRVFRFDSIDAKHLPEFHQMDGIAMEKDMSLKKLLGILKQITMALGFKEVVFKPGYFPFTEPSVEGYVKIDGLGYIEIFGSGLFRPEVLEMAGVRHNVGAWGMGVDRLAMACMGISDIRDLYSHDIEKLRMYRVASYKAALGKA